MILFSDFLVKNLRIEEAVIKQIMISVVVQALKKITIFIMKNLQILGLFLSMILMNPVIAQEDALVRDTLWYLCGEYELITNYEFMADSNILFYQNKKGKYKEVEVYYLFSINKADGNKQILYGPTMDVNEGDTLTIDEMEAFVIGGYLGKTESRAPLAIIESFAIGFTTPFVVASMSVNPFFSILIPALNSTFIGVTSPSKKRIKKKYPKLAKNELFIEGYRESAKQKRTKKSIVGGLAGVLISMATVFFIISR